MSKICKPERVAHIRAGWSVWHHEHNFEDAEDRCDCEFCESADLVLELADSHERLRGLLEQCALALGLEASTRQRYEALKRYHREIGGVST